MREVAEDLKRRSELAVPPGDDYLEKPEVAALALVDLYSIAREVLR